jgi:hypothetical protein
MAALTRDDLIARLRDPEDSFVERKPQGVTGDDVKRTAVAFANSVPIGREAILFIGVRDDGTIEGISGADSFQKKTANWLRRDCYPPINYTTELLSVAEHTVLAVVIPPSQERPHFSGPAFIRIGTKTEVASVQLYDDLLLSRVDKARDIARYRGTTVTVWTEKHTLGHPDFKPNVDGHAAKYPCVVENVNAHFATMRIVADGRTFAEPLRNIVISYDHEENRPMLVVERDCA